jgi:ABC-type nickel/cobalt efflux system permease component RcnA
VIVAAIVSRFGLISAVMLLFTVNALGGANLSAELTTWYAPYGLVSLLLFTGLSIYSFWRSMGDQEFVSHSGT